MGSLGADNPAFVPDSEIVTTQDKGQGVESEAGSEKGSLWKPNFTARQWRFLVIFGVTNFFRAASILCTPSFFPSRVLNKLTLIIGRFLCINGFLSLKGTKPP